jgi:hypothetical protein
MRWSRRPEPNLHDHSQGWDVHLGNLRAYASDTTITPRG